ncbi:GatB/YqeY domain-containing protein [Candidatus Omnitrophota bacterium]
MELKQKIEDDFKQALKSKNQLTVSTLRMLKAALHNKEIEQKGKDLSTEQIYKIISKQVKQRQESIEQFKKGKRDELAEQETKELKILEQYLPQLLSEDEVTAVVKKIITENAGVGPAELGKVMKLAMAEFKGQADGKLVNQIALKLLKPT